MHFSSNKSFFKRKSKYLTKTCVCIYINILGVPKSPNTCIKKLFWLFKNVVVGGCMSNDKKHHLLLSSIRPGTRKIQWKNVIYVFSPVKEAIKGRLTSWRNDFSGLIGEIFESKQIFVRVRILCPKNPPTKSDTYITNQELQKLIFLGSILTSLSVLPS